MFTPKAHIIIIDGALGAGRKMFAFELALTLLYNAQRTALVLADDSPLRQAIQKRRVLLPQLLTPEIISRKDFYSEANKYNAVIIPEATMADELALTASTYITIIPQSKQSAQKFAKKLTYINSVWELKKKIAATYGRSLNWIICENNLKEKISDSPSPELAQISRTYGFRVSPPLNRRIAYQNNITGISAQDKSLPLLKKDLTYDDICAKREITKLAEFIFNA
jgi:hypothetical protein